MPILVDQMIVDTKYGSTKIKLEESNSHGTVLIINTSNDRYAQHLTIIPDEAAALYQMLGEWLETYYQSHANN